MIVRTDSRNRRSSCLVDVWAQEKVVTISSLSNRIGKRLAGSGCGWEGSLYRANFTRSGRWGLRAGSRLLDRLTLQLYLGWSVSIPTILFSFMVTPYLHLTPRCSYRKFVRNSRDFNTTVHTTDKKAATANVRPPRPSPIIASRGRGGVGPPDRVPLRTPHLAVVLLRTRYRRGNFHSPLFH